MSPLHFLNKLSTEEPLEHVEKLFNFHPVGIHAAQCLGSAALPVEEAGIENRNIIQSFSFT